MNTAFCTAKETEHEIDCCFMSISIMLMSALMAVVNRKTQYYCVARRSEGRR